MAELKDVGLTRNSDLVELGVDEFPAGDYSELTVDELKEKLREKDLKVSGTKDELIARLEKTE